MTVHVFGLTGGVGSGKSTVAARFRAAGVPVLDADLIAREVVEPGTQGLAAVVDAFGARVLAPDGSLDRAALAAEVFGDDAKRKRLNAILHPRIAQRTFERTAALDAAGERLACYEAALLVENGLADAFRPLVVVAVPESVQVARAMARDACTEAQALARVRAQLPLQAKLDAADYVIDNGDDVASTERRADEVLAAIRGRLGL
jgi:dephospho-CoA kinase